MSRHHVVPSLPTAKYMIQHVLLKLPWSTPGGYRSHSTANLASPHKCRQHTTGTPHPCNCPLQRQERTPIDTTLSLTCKRCVAHRICSRNSELHPRFDRNLLAHQDLFLLQTANLALLRDQTVISRTPRFDRNGSTSIVASSPSTTIVAKILQHDLFRKIHDEEQPLDKTLCVLTKTHTHNRKKEYRIQRCLKQTRPTRLVDSQGTKKKDVFAPCRTPVHKETKAPGLLHVVQSQTQPKTITFSTLVDC